MQSPKCGARTRAGHPCNFRHGRFTREAAEVSKFFRELVKDAHVLTATVMRKHGLRPPKPLRRRTHVKKALAAAKGEKPR
jgi:hypothetical protein